MKLVLRLLPQQFAIHRLQPRSPLPPGLAEAQPVFIVRSEEELSIACPAEVRLDSQACEAPWHCLVVQGPLDFSLTGILARLSAALADAGISLFAVSSFDTDYLLVRSSDIDAACEALRGAGCVVD